MYLEKGNNCIVTTITIGNDKNNSKITIITKTIKLIIIYWKNVLKFSIFMALFCFFFCYSKEFFRFLNIFLFTYYWRLRWIIKRQINNGNSVQPAPANLLFAIIFYNYYLFMQIAKQSKKSTQWINKLISIIDSF